MPKKVASVEEIRLNEMLNFDSLAEAEKVTGKDYHDSKDTSHLGLALHLSATERKRQVLIANDDTHYSSNFSDLVRILGELGFQLVGEFPFRNREDDVDEKLVAYWHDEGIFVSAETYSYKGQTNGPTVNNCHILFNLRLDTDDDISEFWKFAHCSGKFNQEHRCWIGEKDGREGLRHFLTQCRRVGTFMPNWVEAPSMCFHAYTDWPRHSGVTPDYQELGKITDKLEYDRLIQLPDKVKKAILFKEE